MIRAVALPSATETTSNVAAHTGIFWPETISSTHNLPVIPFATPCFVPAEIVTVEPAIDVTV